MIDRSGRKAVAKHQHHRRCDAAHRHVAKLAAPAKGIGRIGRILARLAQHPVAVGIEDKAMEIDGAVDWMLQNPIPRSKIGALDAAIALRGQQMPELGKVRKQDREIKIGMRPRLLPNEGIDSPPAIHPESEGRLLEQATKGYDGSEIYDATLYCGRPCAGNRDMVYIAWEASAKINGARRTYRGVDRFRPTDGLAVEEHVIFDSAVLPPEGRGGLELV